MTVPVTTRGTNDKNNSGLSKSEDTNCLSHMEIIPRSASLPVRGLQHEFVLYQLYRFLHSGPTLGRPGSASRRAGGGLLPCKQRPFPVRPGCTERDSSVV